MIDISSGLAGGISDAGKSVGGGLAKWREQRKANREEAAAFDAFGTALEHGVKQKMLPEGVLTKYMTVGQGTPEQKRGFLKGITGVLNYVDQATERKARMDDRAADNVRANRFAAIQEAQAGRQEAEAGRQEAEATGRSGFMGDVSQFVQPQAVSVPVGGMSLSVPHQRRLSPEMLVGIAAKRGIDVPAGMLRALGDPEQAAFRPEVMDLGDGVTAMTTSRGSAVPVRKPAAGAAGLEVEEWMIGEDRGDFMSRIQELSVKQAQAAFQIRRQARPDEFKASNPFDSFSKAMKFDRYGNERK